MTSMLISGGKAYPITAAQYAAARRHQPIGSVAGLTPPRAAAPVTPAPQPKADTRAVGRASMLAEIGRKYGQDAKTTAEAGMGRPIGLDPKAATIGQPQPKAATGNGLSRGRVLMLQEIERKFGKATRDQAEARLTRRSA